MKTSFAALLKKEDCALLVIDVQEKLVRVIDGVDKSIKNIVRLIRFSKSVDIPVVLTEQENLGETVKEIWVETGHVHPISKITFSCFASEEFCRHIKNLKKKNLIVTGIETHICVTQTALDGIREYGVHVVSDAVASRSIEDKVVALDRLKQNDVTITTTEMLMYELLTKAGTDEFRKALGFLK